MCNRRKRHGFKCEGTVKVFPYAAEKANPFPFCGEVWIKDVLRQMSSIRAAIEKNLQKVDKLGFHVELESFGGISFDALADDVKFGLANLNRFYKKAVVSGEEWVEKTAEFADKIFSGIEIRHFSPEQRGEAKK
jgi:hypothetical protein